MRSGLVALQAAREPLLLRSRGVSQGVIDDCTELTMVEDSAVASRMVHLAQAVDPELINLSPQQVAALQLAQALKAGYTNPHAQ